MTTQTAEPHLALSRLLVLAASAFVVLAAEPLYLLVDTAVVGHLGKTQLGGLGVAASIIAVMYIVGSFVEYGTTSRAARWFGVGDHTAAVHEGVQASWLALWIGLALVGVGEAFAGPFTGWLAGDNPALHAAAESWFRIAVFGMPALMLVWAGMGWMRGVQRTTAPVVIVLCAFGTSALLSPLFVYGAGWGLQGSAWANIIGQWIGGLLFAAALLRSSGRRRIDLAVIRAQLRVGRDLIVRAAGFQASFIIASAVAARMGTAQVAAHSMGMQLWEFTALLLDSFAIAAQSLVGAALGGGDAVVARRTAWHVARLGTWAGLAFAAIYGACWLVLPKVFSADPSVQHQAHLLWPWFIGMLPVAGLVFALDGVLIGAGDMAFMRNLTLVAACAFVPLSLSALHWHWGIGGVWAGLAAFIMVRFIGMMARWRGDRWLVLGAQT